MYKDEKGRQRRNDYISKNFHLLKSVGGVDPDPVDPQLIILLIRILSI
jgi:hypothetical protein